MEVREPGAPPGRRISAGRGRPVRRSHAGPARARTYTSLHPTDDPTGLLLEGVEPDGLAARLGLHEGDHILQIDHLPLTTEADLLAALTHALEATELSVLVERSGKPHLRHFVRAR